MEIRNAQLGELLRRWFDLGAGRPIETLLPDVFPVVPLYDAGSIEHQYWRGEVPFAVGIAVAAGGAGQYGFITVYAPVDAERITVIDHLVVTTGTGTPIAWIRTGTGYSGPPTGINVNRDLEGGATDNEVAIGAATDAVAPATGIPIHISQYGGATGEQRGKFGGFVLRKPGDFIEVKLATANQAFNVSAWGRVCPR